MISYLPFHTFFQVPDIWEVLTDDMVKILLLSPLKAVLQISGIVSIASVPSLHPGMYGYLRQKSPSKMFIYPPNVTDDLSIIHSCQFFMLFRYHNVYNHNKLYLHQEQSFQYFLVALAHKSLSIYSSLFFLSFLHTHE